MDGQVERLAGLVREARSVVALTGAGISVPSGIPDFRSPGSGLWENVNPMEVAHIDAWRADPERFWHFYGNRFQIECPTGSGKLMPLWDVAAELSRRNTRIFLRDSSGRRPHLQVVPRRQKRLHSR